MLTAEGRGLVGARVRYGILLAFFGTDGLR